MIGSIFTNYPTIPLSYPLLPATLNKLLSATSTIWSLRPNSPPSAYLLTKSYIGRKTSCRALTKNRKCRTCAWEWRGLMNSYVLSHQGRIEWNTCYENMKGPLDRVRPSHSLLSSVPAATRTSVNSVSDVNTPTVNLNNVPGRRNSYLTLGCWARWKRRREVRRSNSRIRRIGKRMAKRYRWSSKNLRHLLIAITTASTTKVWRAPPSPNRKVNIKTCQW